MHGLKAEQLWMQDGMLVIQIGGDTQEDDQEAEQRKGTHQAGR